jgi:thiamine biosynthesis lipoprotein
VVHLRQPPQLGHLDEAMLQLEFRAMGCRMSVVLDADERHASQLNQVPAWFEEWEQHLSRFRADSELNQLNRRAGHWLRTSSMLWEVIQLALEAAQWSDGLVSPTLLNALEAAGYDRSFDAIEAVNNGRSIAPMPDGQWRSIKRRTLMRSIQLPINARLDLGGVAKGWAADRAAQRLSLHGPTLVDAGGDIALSGPQANGQPWPIGVSDPLHPDRQLELLMVPRGGIATSGRDYRRWKRNGVWQHHIIDPRTGLPAQTDVLSATVIALSAYQAEVAAKVVLISGSETGLKWIEARPDFAALIVLEDSRVLYSSRMAEFLWR